MKRLSQQQQNRDSRQPFELQRQFGGGGKAAPPTTISSAAPAPTTTTLEVQQSQREARERAAKRKGFASTILAGETGGYQSQGDTLGVRAQGQQAVQQTSKTLLGGI